MTTITIAAVGDILMWGRQIQSARLPNGKYSFDDMFREVQPYLSRADLTIGNLETTFSGRERNYVQRQPRTSWPLFNCPDELAAALQRTGFDVLTTANNHCLDRGVAGLQRTLNILDQHQIRHTGTFRSQAESDTFLMTKVKGISIGILSYTYGTNVKLNRKDQPWLVNYMSNKIFSDIRKLRNRVDVLIVCLHFGVEFQRYASLRQKIWVTNCFKYGADAVLGVHPHVIQPMAFEQVRDLKGINKKRFVIYSLGNFISDRMRNIHTDSGVILYLTISKNKQGKTHIAEISYIPTWVHLKNKGRLQFQVLPIAFPLRYKLSVNDSKIVKKVWKNTTTHLKGNVYQSGRF